MTENVVGPRQVDGFPRAEARGLLPRIPSTPPALLPGPTAHQAHGTWLTATAITFLGWVVATSVLRPVLEALPAPAGPLLLAAGAVAAFVWVFVGLRGRIGEVYLRELAAGYTTLPLRAGGFWMVPRGLGTNYRAPWDYRGVWVLDRSGQVLSAPDPAVDPPGMYPSPERPGMLQLWTGAAWSRRFEEPPEPFA